MELFDRLKLARAFSGLSQAELAVKLEVHPSVVTRYEGSREPGTWVLEKIAQETGTPPEWVKEGSGFRGIVTGRIELPGSDYSVKTLRSIEKHLADILPVFLSENPPTCILHFKARAVNATPSVFVLYNGVYCLVLFSNKITQMLMMLLNNYCKSENMIVHPQEIDIHDYINAYIQPKYQYLKKVIPEDFTYMGLDYLLVEAKVMPPKTPSRRYVFKCLPPENITEVQEAKWITFMSEYLKSEGCTEINVTIEKEDTETSFAIPSFAPKGYSFSELSI